MDDRKLLERAAKAAGYEFRGFTDLGTPLLQYDIRRPRPPLYVPTKWNPLKTHDYAFRLAIALNIDVIFDHEAHVHVALVPDTGERFVEEDVRRAITRAAAAMAPADVAPLEGEG